MKEFQLKNIFFGLEANKIFLAAPFLIIFLANIFITQVRGLEYAGRLAVFAGISSFLAISEQPPPLLSGRIAPGEGEAGARALTEVVIYDGT